MKKIEFPLTLINVTGCKIAFIPSQGKLGLWCQNDVITSLTRLNLSASYGGKCLN